MKLHIPAWRVIKTYLLIGLVVLVVFNVSVGLAWPPSNANYFVTVVWFLSTLLFVILSLTQDYYILEGRNLIQHRFNKEKVFDCNDILFVNEAWSKKNKTLNFYDKFGIVHYLPFDKQGKIYEHVLAKGDNLMSKEEFQERFPNVKL
ncbi:MAG: hypothetical protein NTV44_01545 [Firmicutes bacterium]|nr:hypothetical protein [Bacillota bacterium]